jgi:precorrin-2 dehydrogenase/sirohydrochlorin ferrochelatase
MRYYPAFLDLRGRSCLLVGAGAVGRRKLATLLTCGPDRVLVLDPREPDEELVRLLEGGPAEHLRRDFREEDVDGCALAFACTGDAVLNARVAAACAERGVFCNVADQPEAGSFVVPAHVEQGDLVCALSTSGHSPALAKRIREDLQDYLGSRYENLLALMARLRPLVLELGQETPQNTACFRALVDSELGDALNQGDRLRAEAALRRTLPRELHPRIGELLHGLV